MSELFKGIEEHRRAGMSQDELSLELAEQLALGQSIGPYDLAAVVIDMVADAEFDMGDELNCLLCAVVNETGSKHHGEYLSGMIDDWCDKKVAEFFADREQAAKENSYE